MLGGCFVFRKPFGGIVFKGNKQETTHFGGSPIFDAGFVGAFAPKLLESVRLIFRKGIQKVRATCFFSLVCCLFVFVFLLRLVFQKIG